MSASKSAYPPDVWAIRETSFDPAMVARNETIFALGNGHLGLRGNFEEGHCNAVDGTYVNGFYEETPIVYGEIAYGYAKNRQVMLNVANGKVIRLFVAGDPLDLSTGRLLAYERRLDLRAGLLHRSLHWRSPSGAEVELAIRRLVSIARRHVAAIDYRLRIRQAPKAALLRIESEVDGDTRNQSGAEDPRIGTHFRERALTVTRAEAGRAGGSEALAGLVVQETTNTRFGLACAFDHAVVGPLPAWMRTEAEEARICFVGELPEALEPPNGAELHFTKFLAYCTSLEFSKTEYQQRAQDAAAEAKAAGFEALAAEQHAELSSFWATADISIDGDDALQQSIRYNLFSLFQSAGRDGRTSIAAKGLTGEGYEGHYFWDTEIYVLPVFIYLAPHIARALVQYRLSILDKARARAAEMGQRGALFPWRTIGGEETSPYYPAGSAQYHIDADIAFAFQRYLAATQDSALLFSRGAEMVFETARLWADLGAYIESKGGDFCLNEVTGPDEYTALVNNNLYTNLMAQANLEYAVQLAERLRSEASAEYRRIAVAIALEDAEVEGWRRAAVRMHVPFDRDRGIHKQDDLFLDRAVWDFAHTGAENYPLLLHYHPLVIYRYQVLKQPDVVLAQVLRGDRFSMAEKRRNFDYYDPITTGDSSLSPCIQSVAAAELGYTEKAYGYFMRTARMDLDDVNGNVQTGIHTASMAGTWISLVYGFAGMRDYRGHLSFNPRLPAQWSRLDFKLRFQGRLLEVALTHREAIYKVAEGEPLEITHGKRPVVLPARRATRFSLIPVLACVIFDLDGVITDTAEYHFQAWKRLADELGLPFDRMVNERLKGVSRPESLDIILRHGEKTLSERERSDLAERKNGYYKELIGSIQPRDLLPGISGLLQELRGSGIKIAVASVSHNVWEVVRRLEIEPLLDHIVDPAKVVKGKPDPEIFFRAAEMLGVPFDHCAGIEDAAAGIEAIRSAGMLAVGIGSSLHEADLLVPDTRGLTLAVIRREFSRWAEARIAAGA